MKMIYAVDLKAPVGACWLKSLIFSSYIAVAAALSD